jgi:uncharacterized membrane protein YfcA
VPESSARPRSARFVVTCIGVGLLAGLLSGLFGVGGGTVIVPLLVLILKFDQRLAAFFTMSARKAASLSRSRIAGCMALTS